ncbi:IS605 OrfB family transposase [Actinoplanes italicus]|uniref:IS605 OrfB family transposase n=1 Tax=Actinoplanes italicus TaxID=113567 RepID=A0A2T0JXP6_9ACTN|nr:IS605 OrfB family transposase [Actinoplanes italicus]
MFNRTFGCVRLAWNKTLTDRHAAFFQHGQKTSCKQTDAALTARKQTEELAFLSEVSSVPLQQTLRHQHTAFGNFFAERARYPRFKSRTGRQSAHYTRSAFRIKDGQLRVAKTDGPLRVAWSRPDVDLATMDPTMVIVSREPDGRWFVSFAMEVDQPDPLPATGHEVGIDLGIKDFAVTSDGDRIANPRHLERKARNARRDFLHKTSITLVRQADTIVVEDLAVANMLRNRGSSLLRSAVKQEPHAARHPP